MPDVICLGEVLVEFVASQAKNVPLEAVPHWKCAAGGAPANVAVALQRLGLRAAFCGCVGDDAFGRKLQQTLDHACVDTSFLVVDKKTTTTMVFVADYDDGHKELCFARGADRCLRHENISDSLLDSARCFHYGSITLIDEPGASAQRKALEMARKKKLMITYDPNYRPSLWPTEETAKQVIREAFQYAHVAKISQEEFEVATGHADLTAGLQVVLEQGVELAIVSRGDQGAVATNGHFVVESPAYALDKVVETTGAGDAFLAALITKLLPIFEGDGGTLRRVDKGTVQIALDYANAVGALACTKVGAIPALPTQSEVEAFLTKRRLQNTLTSSTPLSDTRVAQAQRLASLIDHTLLKPNCNNPDDVKKLCSEAVKYGFAMVAVNPALVEECCRLLQGTSFRVGAAIGFPLGQTTSAVKAFETQDALDRGATEIDMVLNVRELQHGNVQLVRDEIKTIVNICRAHHGNTSTSGGSGAKIICKVILETCYLTREQKVMACEMCRDEGVDFVKTSTGFGPAGATVEDVVLMRATVGKAVGVKASGGIRNLSTARAMIDAGANRIGTSSGVAIMEELLNAERCA